MGPIELQVFGALLRLKLWPTHDPGLFWRGNPQFIIKSELFTWTGTQTWRVFSKYKFLLSFDWCFSWIPSLTVCLTLLCVQWFTHVVSNVDEELCLLKQMWCLAACSSAEWKQTLWNSTPWINKGICKLRMTSVSVPVQQVEQLCMSQ